MSNSQESNKQLLNVFFSTFMQKFYTEEEARTKLYLDSFLQQSIIFPGKASSIDNFLFNTANRYFEKEDGIFVEKGNIYSDYCNLIDSIRIDEKIKAVQDRDDYQAAVAKYTEAAHQHSALQDELEEKRDEGIDRIKKRLKVSNDASKEDKEKAELEFLEAKKKFIMNFSDRYLSAKLSEAKNAEENAENLMIQLEEKYGVTGDIKLVLRAKLKCKKAAEDEVKNTYNMGYEDVVLGFGEYVPSISSNTHVLEHIAERVFKLLKIKDETKLAFTQETGSIVENPNMPELSNSTDSITQLNKDYLAKKREIESSDKTSDQKNKALELLKERWIEDKAISNIQSGKEEADKIKKDAYQSMIKAQTKVRDKFLELDKDEKLEECMENNIYYIFSETHINTAKTSGTVGGGTLLWSASSTYTRERTDDKHDAACISFESVIKVPIRYNWLSKSVLKDIDFNKSTMTLNEESGALSLGSREFLQQKHYIIQNLIIGINMKSYFANQEFGDVASSFSAKVGYDNLLSSIKGDAGRSAADTNKEMSKTGFTIPDYIVVLGYELEQVTGFNHETGSQHHQEL